MADFDPEKFEDKYVHYFTELQRAYRNAFETMNETYDSELIHAIDQQILNESEPFYEGSAEQRSADDPSGQGPREHDGEFRIDLPESPAERVRGIVVEEERLHEVLDVYVGEIEAEIRETFGFE